MNDLPILISLNDAAKISSLSRSMLNRYRATGDFPAAVPMGERRVAFVREEVVEWIFKRIEARG